MGSSSACFLVITAQHMSIQKRITATSLISPHPPPKKIHSHNHSWADFSKVLRRQGVVSGRIRLHRDAVSCLKSILNILILLKSLWPPRHQGLWSWLFPPTASLLLTPPPFLPLFSLPYFLSHSSRLEPKTGSSLWLRTEILPHLWSLLHS